MYFIYDSVVFQHPFITNVTDIKPVYNLLLESNAEVIVEEEEIDDVEIKVSRWLVFAF